VDCRDGAQRDDRPASQRVGTAIGQDLKENRSVNRICETMLRAAVGGPKAKLDASRSGAAAGRALCSAALACALLGAAVPSLRAQQSAAPLQPAAAAVPAAAAPAQPAAAAAPARRAPPDTQARPTVDESFSIRHDEDLFQLEEAVSQIAGSLSRISDKVSLLAINSFSFGKDVDKDFRLKAEVIIEKRLLDANANVRLVQCQECQKLETKIVGGVLHLKKGIPSQEARIELAKKLGVDGFIDIGMFRDNRQLTVYLKVTEAETGAIILVDEIVGRQAAKRDAVTLSFGEINFPIVFKGKTHTENALSLTATEQVQLTGRFSFGVDTVLYTDNNQNNTDPHLVLAGGVLLSPFLGYDIVQVPQSTTRLQLYVGVGKLLDPQLNYGDLARAGLIFVVGDRLVVTFGENFFTKTNAAVTSSDKNKQPLLANGAQLNGEAYELRFGYRF
jgi:hypothetical protein